MKQSGRGNVRYVWVLVGGYLVYLAYQQMQLFLQGEVTKTADVAICVVSAIAFAGVGAFVLWREWQAWRHQEESDDAEETASELPEASDEGEEASETSDESEASEEEPL